MKRTIHAIAGILSIVILPAIWAYPEEEADILIRQGVVYHASGFVLTRAFTSEETQNLRKMIESKQNEINNVGHTVAFDAGVGGSIQASITRGLDAEVHGNCDLRSHNALETKKSNDRTMTLKSDVDTLYEFKGWKLVFQLTLRSAERRTVFHWTDGNRSVRLSGPDFNRSVPCNDRSTNLAEVRFNRPIVLDYELPCDDEALFKTLAEHKLELGDILAVELPAGFPLVDNQEIRVTDSMISGDARKRMAPAQISLTFGPAACCSPWEVRPQTADGKKLPVTLRMALDAIQRDIEQDPELPREDGFKFNATNGLCSVCGIPFGRIALYRDGPNGSVRVVPLLRINDEYHGIVPGALLDNPLSRFADVEFVCRCIDNIADFNVEKLSLWNPSEREALLHVLDRVVSEDPSDESAWRAAARLRLADSDGMMRLQGATALEKLAKGTHGELLALLYRMHAAGRLDGASEEQVTRWRQGAAELGDAQAQFEEGRQCTKKRNFKEAFSWIKQAAEQGLSEAQRVLGDFYLNGRGVKRDASKAAKWYEKSGTPEARVSLGRLYVKGDGVRQNVKRGMKLIFDAAKSGNPYAQAQLGLRYKYGEAKSDEIHWWNGPETSGRKNAEKALKWFCGSAAKNDSYGLARLGVCYRDGYGVESNAVEAVRLFRKAIENDTGYWGEYQRLLGKCYRDGTGVARDVAKAVQLFREAAEWGDSEGQYCLGLCYLNGTGVEKNAKEGRKWLGIAAENGSEHAKGKLRSLSKK